MGTLTENGVSMEVKAAVAVFDSGEPSLRFVLLPFQPSAEEVAKLQAKDTLWLLDKATPDAKKWKNWCPYGYFELGWGFEKTAVGDAKKATVFVYGYGLGKQGSNLNINKFGDSVDVSLAGPVKEGQEVTLTSKGSDKLGDSTMVWDLKVKAKVLAAKKKQ